MRVQLQAPLTSRLTRKGDIVAAKILDPAAFRGGMLEGDVREIRTGGAKRSTIEFQFHTLHLSGSKVRISASLVRLSNSKREEGCDETGSAIDTGQTEDSPKRSFFGAVRKLGQNDKGPARGSIVQLSSQASALTLAVGSELVLQVERRKE